MTKGRKFAGDQHAMRFLEATFISFTRNALLRLLRHFVDQQREKKKLFQFL